MKFALTLLTVLVTTIVIGQNVVTDKLPGSNCSNTVHNKLLPDAQNRSPSECEVIFDWKVRTALRDAFSKVFNDFPGAQWVISDTAVEVLDEIGKGAEKSFFALTYYFNIDLNPASPVFMDWYEKRTAAMEELRTPSESSYKKFADLTYRMNNAIRVRFYVTVNGLSQRIYFIKGGQQVINVPGATYAVKGPRSPGLNGGDEDNSSGACLIVFGKSTISTQKEQGGGASVAMENQFPKGVSRLTVQNISMRIECNDELLNKILKNADFKALAALLK